MGRVFHRITGGIARIVNFGLTPELSDSVRKRIRLTNGLSLFGAFVLIVSIPFDWLETLPWMVGEDVLGSLAYLTLPFLNKLGRRTLSRLLCVSLSNLLVLGNAAALGRESGAAMVFIAITAVPFAIFDLRQNRAAVTFSVLLSMSCFAVVQSGALSHLRQVPATFSVAHYWVYSAVVTFATLLFCLLQTGLANARAEEALRQDIEERLRAQRELELTRQTSIYSAKMAALGEMSGNIAHEVNNPLSAILLRAQRLVRLLAKQPIDTETVRKTAHDIELTVHRIRRIVDALRSFARDAEMDPMRPESVHGIVRDTVELCAQRFNHHAVDLRVDDISTDLFVLCRNVQISQILLNLLGNAHDAVENQPRRWVRISVDATHDEVQIAVTDSGPGIPPDLEPRIMSPFFTTKEVGKGTGLGLSVSKGIAEAHAGRLEYDARSPETRFVLTLKRIEAPPVVTLPPAAPQSNADG